MASDLPCDGDGNCMKCKSTPPEAEVVLCRTCATPWHVQCLLKPPATLAAVADWECPDCDATLPPAAPAPAATGGGGALIASIRAIEADATLTEQEKAKRRQDLLSGGPSEEAEEDKKGKGKEGNVLDLLDEKFKCSFCMLLPDRPVTTPCGHNFCLKCFQKWVGQGKKTCAKCRTHIPSHMSSQPRINAALVVAIRMAKTARSVPSDGKLNIYHFMRNEDRPEKAFTTERAKKSGKANAASGQIFVTVPPDHFGPILAENDPKRNQGLLVGELWEDRMECRQWGAHLPHVAGIAGQSDVGAQSVALSGGYEDDEDHGEWFLYTGSGGRDLSGNKRTNKNQSFDQTFMKSNEALRVSCKKGYPVRVVRSHKEKRSSYAPEKGVRYDGIYRIEQCWRKVGIQGHKVCRYLFVRCDNEPAPWTSDEHGDRPRPLPAIKELKDATDLTVRKESPAWDYDEKHGWKWSQPPPISRKPVTSGNQNGTKARKITIHVRNKTVQERLLKEFHCQICRQVMVDPLTTPCAHNFCKSCLLGSYADQSFVRERTRAGGRTLRAQKITKKCPMCPTDISDFLQNPHVNREMMDLIETLKRKIEEENAVEPSDEDSDVGEKSTVEAGSNEDNSREEGGEEGKLHEDEPGASKVEDDTHAESPSNRKRKNAAVRRKPAKKPKKDDEINEAGAAEDGKQNEDEPEGASKVGEGTKAELLPDRKRKNAAVKRKPAKKSKENDDINIADHERTIKDGPTTVDLKATDVEDTENELKIAANSPTGGQSPSSPLHVPTASDD